MSPAARAADRHRQRRHRDRERDTFRLRACEIHDERGVRFAVTRRPIVNADTEPLVLRDDFASIDDAQRYADEVNERHDVLWTIG